jgi:diguanylate cyclase (GGDEF)-like protein
MRGSLRDRESDSRELLMIGKIADAIRPMVRAADAMVTENKRDADAASADATRTYRHTNNIMIIIFSATLVLGVGLILWLTRVVVPRTRGYADFAARVSAGEVGTRLDPRGDDELADLGRSLDAMVTRHEEERDYQRDQASFIDAMQVSESEDEAEELITRHLERSIPESCVVVLNRNNSDDRLEPRTPVEPDSALAARLDGVGPRACLAIRLGRRHEGGGDGNPLLSCAICGGMPERATCDPLVVSGGVIGSVLVTHPRSLDNREKGRIHDTVTQAAPVLANLRNLAIAELRAATDALTGLPNNRGVRDTLKRMGAHATRAQSPLGALLIDLDHFKQINDTYGHGRGDDVLATVGEVMRSTVRDSDFVGRYGGEEFLVLLPDTDFHGSVQVAGNLRSAIEKVTVPSIDRAVTASIGVAVMPEDGADTDTLVRNADRALYAAKSLGRNRVECARSPALDAPAT